ncbi:hypothetical protein ACA910_016809 [Epithemia clementina (nom. ined.)]
MLALLLSSALLLTGTQGFAPLRPNLYPTTTQSGPVRLRALPSDFQNVFSSFSLADALEEASDAAGSVVGGVSDAAGYVMDAVPATDNGWFGFLTGPIEGLLDFIHTACGAVGLDANGWGISIIILTLLIKVLTFPLTKSQLESTSKMQAMAPAIKEIQAKYQSNPEVMNQKVAEFYQVNEINPLAGCIPSLVQIPVFIGLYRAVLNLAKENKLDEPFLFLPNLEGPTYGADPAHGSDWLFQGWTENGPSLGWDDTIAFLILPVLLVVSQFAAMELMQPKGDAAQQQNNIVLKILPVLIGWFALNVPAALSVYWFVNNIVTTTISVAVRSSLKFEPVSVGGSATAVKTEPTPTIFAPPREKPAGFGQTPTVSPAQKDAVKPITVIDAVVEEDDDEEDEDETEETSSEPTSTSSESKPKKKAKRIRKRKK